jgi:hypothetical protein
MPPTAHVDRRTLLVLAGLPGAGKSTLLAKLQPTPNVVVLDSEQIRGTLRALLPTAIPYALYRVLVHTVHRCRIAWYCATAAGPVIAHEPSTRSTTRALLVVIGWITRRRRVLVWLHVEPDLALAGQHKRGRLIRRRSFRRHVRRADRLAQRLRAGRVPRGWGSVHVLTRDESVEGLHLKVDS